MGAPAFALPSAHTAHCSLILSVCVARCMRAQIVGVQSREVLLNAGNVHCITQQHVKAR